MSTNQDNLLRLLEEEGKANGLRWVCRNSTTGRGLRLHQVTQLDGMLNHALAGDPTFVTPREALEHYFGDKR